MTTVIGNERPTQVNACIQAIELTDSDGSNTVVTEDTYGEGIYKTTAVYDSGSGKYIAAFYIDPSITSSCNIKEAYLYSSLDVDVDVYIEKNIINDSTWVDLGLAFTGVSSAYLAFKATPDANNPVDSQDWNQIPLNIGNTGTAMRIRCECDGAAVMYCQVLED